MTAARTLWGGHRVSKDDLRIECYGTVDELNATIGLGAAACSDGRYQRSDAILERVQSELFNLGSQLATRAEDIRPTQPIIHPRHIERLEQGDRSHERRSALAHELCASCGGALTSVSALCVEPSVVAQSVWRYRSSHRDPVAAEVIHYPIG